LLLLLLLFYLHCYFFLSLVGVHLYALHTHVSVLVLVPVSLAPSGARVLYSKLPSPSLHFLFALFLATFAHTWGVCVYASCFSFF